MLLGKKIVIAPHPKAKRDGTPTAKCYPYWRELIDLLESNGHSVIQVSRYPDEALTLNIRYNLTLEELTTILNLSDLWISVDTFLPHFAKTYNIRRPGAVLWGISDPKVFGYPEHNHILKDPSRLRPNQFEWWEDVPNDPDVWYNAEEVFAILKEKLLI